MKPDPTATRDAALDFTRGALVLCMILYHAVNYSGADPAILRHLRFLPGAFVFLAGFGVGRIYLHRWVAGDVGVARRLWWRGVRILMLFLALNVTAHALMPASYNRRLELAEFAERLDVILGPGGVRAAVFGVLLPIAYVLAACGAALALGRSGRQAVLLVGALVFGTAAMLATVSSLPFNLELAGLGFLGVLSGCVAFGRAPSALRHPMALLFVCTALQAVLTRGEPGFALTTTLITATLALLYVVGRRVSTEAPGLPVILLLGRNSLLAYLLQIAALQLLFRTMRASGLGAPDLPLAIAFTAVTTTAGIAATSALRPRLPLAERTYRALFA